MKKKISILPVFLFLSILSVFFYLLLIERNPSEIPSQLINKEIPNSTTEGSAILCSAMITIFGPPTTLEGC